MQMAGNLTKTKYRNTSDITAREKIVSTWCTVGKGGKNNDLSINRSHVHAHFGSYFTNCFSTIKTGSWTTLNFFFRTQ